MTQVKNQAARAQSLHPPARVHAELLAATGLYSLRHENYAIAASSFLKAPEHVTEGDRVSADCTSRDAAAYGCLCALATYSRQDLKTRVLEAEGCKHALSAAPEWRELIQHYLNNNYKACFSGLRDLKPKLLLDPHLAPHVSKLHNKALDRAYVLYFRPFSSVKLGSMATAFGLEVAQLEDALVNLISKKQIQARIDSQNKVLHARHADTRVATFERAIGFGDKYARDVKAVIMAMALVSNDLVVRRSEADVKGAADLDSLDD